MYLVRDILRISFWTVVSPIRVHEMLLSTRRAWLVRAAWATIGSLTGLLLAMILPNANQLPSLLILPATGAALAIIGGILITDAHEDALGIMCLGLLPFALIFKQASPAVGSPPTAGFGIQGFLGSALFLLGFGILLFFGWKLSGAGGNRSFLFWPIGSGMMVGAAAIPNPPAYQDTLRGLLGPLADNLYPAALILLLLAFNMSSTEVCIQSYRHFANTSHFYAHELAAFKRWLCALYGTFAVACFAASLIVAASTTLHALALVFLAAAILQLSPFQYLALVIWLTRANRQLRSHPPTTIADPAHSALFRMPTVPLAPLGLRRHLDILYACGGAPLVGFFAAELLIHTCYYRAPLEWIELIDDEDPLLGYEIRQQLAEAAPRPATSGAQDASASAPSGASPTPLVVPRLHQRVVGSERLGTLLFAHDYQAPRGKEGSSLAALPIWFPVADYPMEQMTLSQIIYRSLTSVREPFRRTHIVLRSSDLAGSTYTELLAWAVDWAQSSFGASVVPIALSLKKLVANQSELEAIADQIRRVRTQTTLNGNDNAARLLHNCCRKLIELGSLASAKQAEELATAVEAGNAWMLIEDDRQGSESLAGVKNAFDLVFGEAGISHVTVIVVTSHAQCRVLSDSQTFEYVQPVPPQPADTRLASIPTSMTALICRAMAYWGTPSVKVALAASGVVALGLILLVLVGYEFAAQLVSSLGGSAKPSGQLSFPLRGVVVGGSIFVFMFFPLITGYIWGLGYGSEEVRRSAVELMMTSFIGGLASLLILLPGSMTPGWLKTMLIALAALPGAALLGLSLVMVTSLIANVVWLVISLRILRQFTRAGLQATCKHYQVILHIARNGVTLALPGAGSDNPELPLLVAFRGIRIIPLALQIFPSLISTLSQMTFDGLKKRESGECDYAASSLLLTALLSANDSTCTRCLDLVAEQCKAAWNHRDQFGEYRRPSTSFTMNTLEYAARQICYLTDIEELVVVR